MENVGRFLAEDLLVFTVGSHCCRPATMATMSEIGSVMRQKMSVSGPAPPSPWLEGVSNSSEVYTL